VDPSLDRECGYKQPHKQELFDSGPALELYRKSLTFPVLSGRLTTLEKFAAEEQTNSFWALLRDKSDTKERAQFIVVVVFGLVALLLAVVNTVLAVLQVVYSIKSYNLALKQQ